MNSIKVNMFRSALYLTLILLCPSGRFLFSQTADYARIFGDDYKMASISAAEVYSSIVRECDRYHVDSDLAVSVVFPELLRASLLRDKIESFGLYILYVNNGKPYADFSTGIFQMKPSFIETLEERASRDPRYAEFSYPVSLTGKELRKKRLDRIRSVEWQCRYLAFFVHILFREFPVESMDMRSRVLFCSAAYNVGLNQSYENIVRHIGKETFPYGPRVPVKQYSYSSVSLWYYMHTLKENM